MLSCSREEVDITSDKLTPITFNIGIGHNDSRAISDGTSVNQLVYAVFGDKGQVVIPKTVVNDNGLFSSSNYGITMSLPSETRCRAVFWAQNKAGEAYYSITDDMNLEVDYQGSNNDELRDAFWCVTEFFTVSEGNTVSVILERAFAQLNAATYPFDWEYVQEFYGFKATKSSVVITNVANRMNLLSGEVSGSVNVNFTPGNIPTEILASDVDADGKDEDYTYLSMSYVLAGENPTNHSAIFFYHNEDGKTVTFSDARSETITLQRNCRCDVVGQVLSDNGDLNIREYIDSGNGANQAYPQYVYYNVSEPTTFESTIYNLSNYDAGLQFASVEGQMVTMNDILFTGKIWVIELGEYRGGSYVKYNNTLNNVVFDDLSVSACIECHEWFFSPAAIAYGKTELNNCSMTGTTTICETATDKHGVTHDVIAVDIGVRNESDAVFNGGEYGTIFAWTHAVVDLNGATVGTLYCGTCDSTKHSWMRINAGTTIDKVICCEPRKPYVNYPEYSTTMTIRKGAKVGSLQLVSTDVEFLLIEEGAEVGSITCEGVEYTYKELREAMGLSYPVVIND